MRIVEQAEGALVGLLSSFDEKVRLETAKTILTKLSKVGGWSSDPKLGNLTVVNVNNSEDGKEMTIRAIFGAPRREKAKEVPVVEAEVVENG